MSNKGSHKRQRTHFNLGKLNEDNNSNRESNCDSLGSYHNISNEQKPIVPSFNSSPDNKNEAFYCLKYFVLNYNKKFLNEQVNVLIEEVKDKKSIGHTENYLKVIINRGLAVKFYFTFLIKY